MLVLRLLTTGLCAASVVMLATFHPVRFVPVYVETMPRSALPDGRDRPPPVSVVDVAAGVAPSAVLALVHRGPDEVIRAVDDRVVNDDVEAGAIIASLAPPAGGFVDLTVSSAGTERRVLVLLH